MKKAECRRIDAFELWIKYGLIDQSGEVNGTPLQYPCLENPMHGGAW